MKKPNPVKKNMDKFHKPKTHRDKTKYTRKGRVTESKMTIQEIVEKLNRSNKDKRVIFYNRTDDGLKEIEFYYSSELGNNTKIVFEEV